ncbi:hypothetical protein [Microvirga sp. 17 mud 1-3]|uniref:hypothetical protein n=1 Tax=Microvirga sp. 17 mud 1-3 TaxID=2082949 RepID=UPI000D6CD9D3|nr:hypothetical protein [Microvirga sp. 17 mud 1-3]AWM86741.1 hypothetical protein C4E04_08380 [Microvirga sp. 17 mud 1-3]
MALPGTLVIHREVIMPELVREWPHLLNRVLAEVRPADGRGDCYVAEVDLSEDELRALNLFEASARHEHVAFTDPATAQGMFAYLNTPVGLGKPLDGSGIARVRISFTGVQTMLPLKARSETRADG